VIRRIISGGQTGVDRAALDVAAELGVPRGGWCPRGRRAEDGRIPPQYPLVETSSATYGERTRRNVSDADATLILCRGPLSGGTALTHRYAVEQGKRCWIVDLCAPPEFAGWAPWCRENRARVLNVAGPRASQQCEIYSQARSWLIGALTGFVSPRAR
jgi:hypothetical protein